MLAEVNPSEPRIDCHVEFRHKDLIKAIPGAKWDRDREVWHAPLTWSTCLALRSTFDTDLEIGPVLGAWASKYRTEVQDPALAWRDVISTNEGDPDLFGHQRADVKFLATVRRGLLASEMGTGKTGSVIRTLVELSRRGENVFPVLVAAPKSVKIAWKREFDKFWPGLTVQVVTGTAAQRRKQLLTPAHVYVMNYESLRSHSRISAYGSTALRRCIDCGGEDSRVTTARCQTHVRELNERTFRTVIADEAHRIKDPAAQQTRALKAAAAGAEFRYAMTGTPIANDVVDLWSILNFIDPVEWPSKTRWIDRLCTPPDAPVLMADGTFKEIGQIVPGDLVVGFDKTIPRLELQPTRVVATERHEADLVKVTMESGKTLYCTPDHLWLDARRYLVNETQRGAYGVGAAEWNSDPVSFGHCACGYTNNAGNFAKHVRRHPDHAVVSAPVKKPAERRYQTVSSSEKVKQMTFVEAHPGNRLTPVVDVPEPLDDKLRETAAWLGGMWDGEGSVRTICQSVTHNEDICQKIRESFDLLGIPYTEKHHQNETKTKGVTTTAVFTVTGGRSGWVRLMHYAQPLKRFKIMNREYATTAHPLFNMKILRGFGAATGNQATNGDKVVSVEPAGRGEVVSIETEAHTYVVYGYASHNCDITYNVFGGIVVSGVRPGREDEFASTVYPRMRRMTKEVVLPFLPPVLEERRDIPMTPKQQKAYDELAENLITVLESGEMLTATNTLTMALRLLQLASSYGEVHSEEVVDPDTGEVVLKEKFLLTDPSSKIDAFLEDLDDFKGRSIVVFAVSRQLIMLLSAHLKKKGIEHGLIVGGQHPMDRQLAIDEFQSGASKLILVTLAAGGTGITLTAADTAIYLQRSWSLIDMEQAAGRYHRIGSERHTSITRIDYVTPGSIEEAVIAALGGKSEGLEDLVRDKDLLSKAIRGDV